MQILMCHDGSEQTDKALRFGAVIAKACAADVTLLGIAETGGVDAAVMLAHLQRMHEVLASKGIRAELVSKYGSPVAEILGHNDKANYDLVIIGAGLPHSAMPAKSLELVRQMGPPMLLVVGERAKLKRILICTGGDRAIEDSVRQVSTMARATGAAITLLHVLAQPPLIYSSLIEREKDVEGLLKSDSELGKCLSHHLKLLKSQGLEARILLRSGLVADEVMDEAERGDYDLIVVGSSIDRGPFYRYLLPDITQEIVNRAPCPVLVGRHPTAPRPPEGWIQRTFRRFFGRSPRG